MSVNVGHTSVARYARLGATAIDKQPVRGQVAVTAPGARGTSGSTGSAIAGDQVHDVRNHGGDDQAVYAYGREELDSWEVMLGRGMPNGSFGENLTTRGIDTTNAVIGERWALGSTVVLEVSATRMPCRTFAGWMNDDDWIDLFIQRGMPGVYLRVIVPGMIAAGDEITIISRPYHGVTSGMVFRAFMTEHGLLPILKDVPALSAHQRSKAAKRAMAGQRGQSVINRSPADQQSPRA